MLLKVFRENQAFTVFFLLLLSVIHWSLTSISTSYDPGVYTLFNYGAFYLFPGLNSISNKIGLSTAFNLILILFTGNYLSRIAVRYQLISSRNLMPMLVFFFLCLPWLSSYSGFSYTLLTLPVLFYVTDNLFQSGEKKSLAYSYFNNSLLLAVASFFNHFLLFYSLFLIFLFFRLRGTQWRELVFIPVGIGLPYAILLAVMYLLDVDIPGFIKSYGILFEFKYMLQPNITFFLVAFLMLILFLISSWKALNQFIKMKILTRKYSISFLMLFFLSLIIILLFPYISRESMFFLAAPFSILLGFYFISCRPSLINQILFFLFMFGNVAVFVQSFFGI